MSLREQWKVTDEALDKLVESGVPNGCLLVYSSAFNYHLSKLSGAPKLSNFDVRYHAAKAKEDLIKAQEFVKSKVNI